MPPDPNLYYHLRVKHSGKLLTALDNGEIVQWGMRPDSNQKQKWKYIEQNNFSFFIIERDGKEFYLQKKTNQDLELKQCNDQDNQDNQKWQLIKNPDDDYYLIRSVEGRYIDVASVSKKDGATVWTWNARYPHNNDNEKWQFEPVQLIDTTLTPDNKKVRPSHMKHLKNLLESFKNLIFQGPPGTSKTYNAKLLAASVVLGEDNDQKLEQAIGGEESSEQINFLRARFPGKSPKGSWSIVQFHPAYNYEDFVRGIEVKGNGATVSYNAVRRIFDRMSQTAWKAYRKDAKNCPKYVLIIDEINRAHLAAVLGELIYALEYRGSPVDSPYAVQDQNEESTQIIVPPNLYIIGTMNTADRSIGHIDYAVRRRFAFVPLLPEEEPINSEPGKKLFREIKNLFKSDNDGRAKTLSPEFHADDVQPGHTYFITHSSEVIDELANKFTYQVYSLLREYFKDGILINSPKLFNGKLGLDTPRPPQEVLKIVTSFLNG